MHAIQTSDMRLLSLVGLLAVVKLAKPSKVIVITTEQEAKCVVVHTSSSYNFLVMQDLKC